MVAKKLTSMEIDAIGEILNISLGSSATAISTMLDARVDITTPIVKAQTRDEFEFTNLEPAVGVEITYVEGLTGSNIMLLKRTDVRIIVGMLMGMEIPDEEFELNEMYISAICEVMNQMMGASSTALSELLGKVINISTPVSFEAESSEQFKEKYFIDEEETMVVINFTLSIGDKMESEFMNLMPMGLAKELVGRFIPDAGEEEEEEEEEAKPVVEEVVEPTVESVVPPEVLPEADTLTPQPTLQQTVTPAPQETQPQTPVSAPQMPIQQTGVPTQGTVGMTAPAVDSQVLESMTQMMDMLRQQITQQQEQIKSMQAEPKKIKVQSPIQHNLEAGPEDAEQQEANLGLIMGVPLDVSVEIGRTKKLVKDILDLNKGSLVVLDKLAGEQVDLFVNGQCIAKGDVVVVDDNFGIRITEILKDSSFLLD